MASYKGKHSKVLWVESLEPVLQRSLFSAAEELGLYLERGLARVEHVSGTVSSEHFLRAVATAPSREHAVCVHVCVSVCGQIQKFVVLTE